MINFFSSIKLTFINLIVLTILMFFGVFLSFKYPLLIRSIGNGDLISWTIKNYNVSLSLNLWLGGVFFGKYSIFFNALFCVTTKILPFFVKNRQHKKTFFYNYTHIFYLIILSHGLSLFVGYKHNNIELFKIALSNLAMDIA